MLSLGACTPARTTWAVTREKGAPELMGVNERRIVQEIKTIANLEHRCNPYNSSWGLVLECCKQLLEEKSNE